MRVRLSEMRGGGDTTPAHQSDGLAEMVCSNSFRSDDDENNAVGLLHHEMRALDSLIMRAADAHRVPAGSALAVDREGFAAEVTQRDRGPSQHRAGARADRRPARFRPDDRRHRPADRAWPRREHRRGDRQRRLAFFDAIAPIVHRDSIDMDICWMAARWDKGGKDYINCPMDKEQYVAFRQRCSTARRPSSRSGRRTRPTSRAACRSR